MPWYKNIFTCRGSRNYPLLKFYQHACHIPQIFPQMTAWVPYDSVFALQGPNKLFLNKNTWKLLTLRVQILLMTPMYFKNVFPLKQHQQSFDLICVLVQTSTENCWILPKIATARQKGGMEKSMKKFLVGREERVTGREQTGAIEATWNTFWLPTHVA